MALRLRRGTDAERQTITPLEGELIYTTDTEKLYVGDGTTVGGNPIDSDTITDQLSDLSDVALAGLQDGQTIAYDANNNRFEPADLASSINDLTDVDTTGVDVGDILKWDGNAFVAAIEGAVANGATYSINIDGDVSGSVYADDSTILIDGVNAQILADEFAGDNTKVFINTTNRVEMEFNRRTDDITDVSYGAISFTGTSDVEGSRESARLVGGDLGFFITHDSTGTATFPQAGTTTITESGIGFGTYAPAEALDITGNGKFTGFVQFGSLTSTERDALTAANGMVIYNETNNKFEGYQNGAWINLDDGTAAS